MSLAKDAPGSITENNIAAINSIRSAESYEAWIEGMRACTGLGDYHVRQRNVPQATEWLRRLTVAKHQYQRSL